MERRRFPRVELSASVTASRVGHDPALSRGETITGSLLNASRGGVAFAVAEAVEPGDAVRLSVRTADGQSPFQCLARVVACTEDLTHGRVVRCVFDEPTENLDWISTLVVEPSRQN